CGFPHYAGARIPRRSRRPRSLPHTLNTFRDSISPPSQLCRPTCGSGRNAVRHFFASPFSDRNFFASHFSASLFSVSHFSVFTLLYSLLFIICWRLAAVAPFAPMRSDAPNEPSAFPGWPDQLEGHGLTQLPLSSREERFAADFPGRIARFSDGEREMIIR